MGPTPSVLGPTRIMARGSQGPIRKKIILILCILKLNYATNTSIVRNDTVWPHDNKIKFLWNAQNVFYQFYLSNPAIYGMFLLYMLHLWVFLLIKICLLDVFVGNKVLITTTLISDCAMMTSDNSMLSTGLFCKDLKVSERLWLMSISSIFDDHPP